MSENPSVVPPAPVGAAKPEPERVLSTHAIAVCAVLLVLVAGAAAWLLLANYGGGSTAGNARLEGIRTVGTIVLGAGGAVALLLAARRQQTAERDLAEKRRDLALKELDQQHARNVQRHVEKVAADTYAYQQRVAEDTRQDAVERRITELYTKAVEQLGSDKAPVRLGGLYALERLAQDTESQRQTIVSVLCAYLRMPYDARPLPDTPGAVSAPGADTDAERVPVSVSSREKVRERAQEEQVRLTAQRILGEHLQPGGDPDHFASTFWAGINLDLTGATLLDFTLQDCRIGSGHFSRATFAGYAVFAGATFAGPARFDGATFAGPAVFAGATFAGPAVFAGATFGRDAAFNGARFDGDTRFDKATFAGYAVFDGATFGRDAVFAGATFAGYAVFAGATFGRDAGFDGARFDGDTRFDKATFAGDAVFDGATFAGDAVFDGATFAGYAVFDGATFGRYAGFDGARFDGDTRFDKATFTGDAGFDRACVRVATANRLMRDSVWPEGWAPSPEAAEVPWPVAEGEWRRLVRASSSDEAPGEPEPGVPGEVEPPAT